MKEEVRAGERKIRVIERDTRWRRVGMEAWEARALIWSG